MRLSEAQSPTAVAEYINSIVREAAQADRRLEWESDVDSDLQEYVGNEETRAPRVYDSASGLYEVLPHVSDKSRRIALNRIQNSVISMAAIQAADPPKIEFSPRESGEPPVAFLNTNEPMAQQIAANWMSMGVPFDPMQPLPPELADDLQTQIAAAEQLRMQAMAAALPEPPGLLPKEVLVEVTDATAADWLQTIHEGMWEAANGQYYFTENTLNKCILGWQPTMVTFNRDLGHPELNNVNSMHVFIDPLATHPGRAGYMVWDEVICEEEALMRYPDAGTAIEMAASQSVNYPGSKEYTTSSVYEQNFERRMVVIRHAWVKYQPYPMTPDEATATNIVSIEQLGTGEFEQVPATDELGQPIADPTGQPVLAQGPEITRSAFIRSGNEVNPGGPMWPQRYAIREIVVIGHEAVIDKQCDFEEFPIAVNVNIPIPYSPYGQGEPKRLKGLQEALNRTISAIVTHHDYTAFPPEFTHEGVVEAMPKEMQDCRTQPNSRISVPANLFDLVGGDLSKLTQILEVPQMGSDSWKLAEFLITSIDKEGNQAEVLQGQASGSWSGEAINSLQNAASQVIRFKSARSEYYLKHLARLFVHCITQLMTPEEAARWSSKYPPAIHAAFHSRAKSLAIDVSVEVSSGSGAAKQAETNNLVAARQGGVLISNDTILERLNIDPDAERQRRMREAGEEGAMIQKPQGKPANGESQSPTALAEPTR